MPRIKSLLKNKDVSGATIFIISTFVQRALSLITTPLYTRILSQADYGLITNYNSWSGIFSVLFTLSIAANAFNKGMVEFKEKRDEFIANMIGLTACTVLAGFVIMSLIAKPFEAVSQLPYRYIVIMFLNLFFDVVYGFWGLCCKFDRKYIRVVVVNLSLSVVSIFITYFAVVNIEYDAAFVKILASSICTIVFGVLLVIRYVASAPNIFIGRYWKYALSFCIPLIPHYMANHLLNQSDRIMITSMCGSDKTAIYSIACKMSEILMVCWTCVSSVFVPWLYKKLDSKMQDEKACRDIKNVVTILMLGIGVITLGIVLVGPEVIKILATEEYYEGVNIIPVIGAGYMALFMCLLCSHLELFYKKNYALTIITLVSAIINIGLNCLFIPKFGYRAAAYTTYIGYFVMLILHTLNIRRLHLSEYVNIKLLIALFAAVSIISFGFLLIYDNALIRYGLVGVIFILACIFHNKIIAFIKYIKE